LYSGRSTQFESPAPMTPTTSSRCRSPGE